MMFAAMLLAAILNPASLVDTFLGTSGTQIGGPIDDFPGAVAPFGMVQWSPDTPSQNAGGGYEYTDSAITGFSLTHLSGPGCSVFGDFAMLPTTGDIVAPATAKQPFSHSTETSAPGDYAVTLGQPGIRAELVARPRGGIGRFTFPATNEANVLINVASNQAGVTDASARIVGNDEVEGFAASGYFCGMPDRYSVYYVARFSRPFDASGVWGGGKGAGSGAWVLFDTRNDPSVEVNVAISFTDAAGARKNLAAEARGWDLTAARNTVLAAWNAMLSHVQIAGGTKTQQIQFYTALYHTMLHPNVISDIDGRYRGFDGAIHNARKGHDEYANYSDWDIYRTEIPLIALLVPGRTSDMMQSLVDAYVQSGWLPRWALVNAPTSVMGGDSVDPVIVGGYVFGARDFDVKMALAAMIKGARDTTSPPWDGWYFERPESLEYQKQGYITNTHTTSVSPVPNGASETLEYAFDDFSIAQFAHDTGNDVAYLAFMDRSANWSNVFDTASGLIAPRDGTGAFTSSPMIDNGQDGFQEGNGVQYSWNVPHDLGDLIRGMGGASKVDSSLDRFFTQLNAGQDKPYAWLGNEPTIGSPWVYLSTGEPWRTQRVVRDAMTTLWMDTPDGIPGNDDLGTMSAWYVWSAIGLYPQNPAVRMLDIGSPLFPHVRVQGDRGPTIVVDAPAAATGAPFVNGVSVNGRATQRTWISLPLSGTTRLAFDLSSNENHSWGTAPEDAPPSFAPKGGVRFPPSTASTLALDAPASTLAPGATRTIQATVTNRDAAPVSIAWHASVSSPATLTPSSGSVTLAPGASANLRLALAVGPSAPAGLYGVTLHAATPANALLQPAAVAVRVARDGEIPPLAWIENRFNDTVMPFDLRTNAFGAPTTVGGGPRDAVLSLDNRQLFVADRDTQSVSVVDTASGKVAATVKVGNSPNGIALAPDGTVWVANYDDATVQAIDPKTLAAAKAITVGSGPRYIAVDASNTHLYVTCQTSNIVTVVDLKTFAVSTLPAGARPTGISLSADGKTAYVANNGDRTVSVVDLASKRIVASIPAGAETQAIALSPNGMSAYVSNFMANTVTVMDLRTNAAVRSIVVGGQPFDVRFTPQGDLVTILHRDNALVRFDPSGTVTANVFLGSGGAYSIALPH